MKTSLKIGVEKVGRSGLTNTEFDRTVTLKKGMRVSVVGTTTVGVVEKIDGEKVTFLSDCDVRQSDNVKFLRAVEEN